MMKRCSGEFLYDGWRSLLCCRRVFAVWGRKSWFVQVYGCHSSVYPGSVLCLETGALTEVKCPLRPQKHSRTWGKGGVQEERSLAGPLLECFLRRIFLRNFAFKNVWYMSSGKQNYACLFELRLFSYDEGEVLPTVLKIKFFIAIDGSIKNL